MKTENSNFKVAKNEKMFALIKDEKGKVVICLGGYQVSAKKFDTFEQAEKYIGTKPYEILVNLIYVVTQKVDKHETESKTEKVENESKENA